MRPIAIHKPENSIDIDFAVPYRHRLRVTDNCFGDDWQTIVNLFDAAITSQRVQVWIDHGITLADPLILKRITDCFARTSSLELIGEIAVIDGGEQIKMGSNSVDRIFEAIHRDGLDRRSTIFAIGGGALLDAVGYAAAIAHRGIRLIRFPTTTLAQADSGVGVKNAINAFGKKNWKGTFAVPYAVVNDSRLLTTLSDRDFRAGFAEALKVSLLKSPDAFEQLSRTASAISQRELAPARVVIQASVLMHLHHITHGGDPFETSEARPLDFGHWSAHKLESMCNYDLRHGEAVAIGVALDVLYSSLKHGLDRSVVDRTLSILDDLHLPTYHPLLQQNTIFEGLEEFRQHLGGRLTLTMLKSVGDMIQIHEIDRSAMLAAINELATRASKGTDRGGF